MSSGAVCRRPTDIFQNDYLASFSIIVEIFDTEHHVFGLHPGTRHPNRRTTQRLQPGRGIKRTRARTHKRRTHTAALQPTDTRCGVAPHIPAVMSDDQGPSTFMVLCGAVVTLYVLTSIKSLLFGPKNAPPVYSEFPTLPFLGSIWQFATGPRDFIMRGHEKFGEIFVSLACQYPQGDPVTWRAVVPASLSWRRLGGGTLHTRQLPAAHNGLRRDPALPDAWRNISDCVPPMATAETLTACLCVCARDAFPRRRGAARCVLACLLPLWPWLRLPDGQPVRHEHDVSHERRGPRGFLRVQEGARLRHPRGVQMHRRHLRSVTQQHAWKVRVGDLSWLAQLHHTHARLGARGPSLRAASPNAVGLTATHHTLTCY